MNFVEKNAVLVSHITQPHVFNLTPKTTCKINGFRKCEIKIEKKNVQNQNC